MTVSERRIRRSETVIDWTGEADARMWNPISILLDASEMGRCLILHYSRYRRRLMESGVQIWVPSSGMRGSGAGHARLVCRSRVHGLSRVTEEICGPALSRVSGLFKDRFQDGILARAHSIRGSGHTIDRVVRSSLPKTVTHLSASQRPMRPSFGGSALCAVYQGRRSSQGDRDTQRDLNIALMNELA